MNQDDQNADFEQKFENLGQASRALSTDVAALNATLQVVGALQTEQAKARERQAKQDALITANKAEARERDSRTRRALVGFGVATAIVLALVAILVYVSLLNHVNDLLAKTRANSYSSCLVRNQATMANADREQALADEGDQTDKVRRIHADSARLLRASVADCEKFNDNKKAN